MASSTPVLPITAPQLPDMMEPQSPSAHVHGYGPGPDMAQMLLISPHAFVYPVAVPCCGPCLLLAEPPFRDLSCGDTGNILRDNVPNSAQVVGAPGSSNAGHILERRVR
jgi:hypothetical protein